MEGAPALDLAPVVLADNQPNNYTLNVTFPITSRIRSRTGWSSPRTAICIRFAIRATSGCRKCTSAGGALHGEDRGRGDHLTRPVQNRYIDQVYGELIRPLAVVPPVAVDLAEHSLVFADKQAAQDRSPGALECGQAFGRDVVWKFPRDGRWNLRRVTSIWPARASRPWLTFDLTPPAAGSARTVRAVAIVGGRRVSTQHGGDSVSAHSGADLVSSGRGVAGARRHQESVEECRVCDGRGR